MPDQPTPWCECKAVGSETCVMNQNYKHVKEYVEGIDETLNGEGGLMTNHIPHLQGDVRDIKGDMRWLKWLIGGVLLSIVGAAIGIIVSG